MFVRKPSETLTGDPAAAWAVELAVVPDDEGEDEEDDEQPASIKAAPIIAAAQTRRIEKSPKEVFSIGLLGKTDKLYINSTM
jgi:hypothetical protein